MSKGADAVPANDDDVTKLFNNIYGFVFFQALATACEFDLFSHLSKHPGSTIESTAAELKLPVPSVRALFLGCAYLGYVRRDAAGKYENAPIAERFLVAGSKENVLPLVRSNNRVQYRALYHMPEALRSGRNVGLQEHRAPGDTIYERLANAPELETIFHEAMECFTRQTVDLLASQPELRAARHLLDVGGGTGQTARALCAAHPPLKVTVFDSASVAQRAAREIAADGLADRVDTVAGDFFLDAFPGGVDAVLFAHVIEIFSEEQVKLLLKKAYDVLPRGGRAIVWGTVANEEETGGAFAAKISLYFLTLASGRGYTYPAADYERWMREIGYSRVTSRSNLPWEHGLIVGEK